MWRSLHCNRVVVLLQPAVVQMGIDQDGNVTVLILHGDGQCRLAITVGEGGVDVGPIEQDPDYLLLAVLRCAHQRRRAVDVLQESW